LTYPSRRDAITGLPEISSTCYDESEGEAFSAEYMEASIGMSEGLLSRSAMSPERRIAWQGMCGIPSTRTTDDLVLGINVVFVVSPYDWIVFM
jgi:hypothetical protein